jgi:hypothetical protein
MRSEGTIVLHKAIVIPSASGRKTSVQDERQKTAESKARAIAQLLHGWGLLDSLSYEDQERLIHDILEIVMLDTSKNDI